MLLIIIALLYSVFMGMAIYEDYVDRKMYIATKPIPMAMNIALVIYAINYSGITSPLFIFILTGLIFGVTGDILLSLPKRFFIFGLVAFLLGHIMYTGAFIFEGVTLNPGVVVISMAVAGFMGTTLVSKMENKKLRIPVIIYLAFITAMVITGISYDLMPGNGIPLFALGAVLFGISDMSLSWDKFIKPFRLSGVAVLMTYYAAQFFFTLKILTLAGVFPIH